MTNKTLISVLLIAIIAVSGVSALDLSEFPKMFVADDKTNTVVIVGKAAKAEDIIGAIDIVSALQTECSGKRLDMAKMDSEIGVLDAYNSIIVGGPCANAAAAKILNYPENCLNGFELGKGYIKLYEWSNGNIAMLVAGTTAVDTRRTTRVLANYKDYHLNGTSMVVSGVSLTDLTIKSVD
jgi:hypothetical protein